MLYCPEAVLGGVTCSSSVLRTSFSKSFTNGKAAKLDDKMSLYWVVCGASRWELSYLPSWVLGSSSWSGQLPWIYSLPFCLMSISNEISRITPGGMNRPDTCLRYFRSILSPWRTEIGGEMNWNFVSRHWNHSNSICLPVSIE